MNTLREKAAKLTFTWVALYVTTVSGMDSSVGYANHGCNGNQEVIAGQIFESFRQDVLKGIKSCDGTLFEDEDEDTLRYFSGIKYKEDLYRLIVECGDNYKRLEYGFRKSNSGDARKDFEVQLRLDAKGNCANHNAGSLIN